MTSLQKQLVGKSSALLPLMQDDRVTDILINGPHSLFVERAGELVAETPFLETPALFDLIERLLIPIGKRIDAAHPYLDGRMSDGSRFHVILPPIAAEGPLISIRKVRRPDGGISVDSFAPPEVAAFVRDQAIRRKNILIAGGTGTGKTTMLSCLLDLASPTERIALVEETREIRTSHPHALHLEGRAPSPDGTGEVTLRSLIRNALRMRPDRIVLGECRGGEAFDMLQAMNTGHDGSLCTIHASSALEALKRLEGLVLLAGLAIPLSTVRDWIASTVHLVLHVERRPGGQRIIGELLSIQGLEGDRYRMTPRYKAVKP